MALLPVFHRIGGWDREAKEGLNKLGRPPKRGKKAGFNATREMKQAILDGYVKYKSKKTENAIYNEILENMFGCVSRMGSNGKKEFIQPDNQPYPSFPQFRYWVKEQTNERDRQNERKGRSRSRSESGSEGSFSQGLSNLAQKVEFDGYNISEKLTGLTEGSVVDAFCVVRAVCGLSGAIMGIGFSHGKENMEAYRMCLFSMAINKVKFGELFAVDIEPDEWPCEGLSDNIIFDRGPGSGFECKPQIKWLSALELPPTYSGQSKATVESSHPRDKKNDDQPKYYHSGLNFVEMARREIVRVLMDNQSSNAIGRMQEEILLEGFTPTPHNIWTYFDKRGRTSAITMPFDEAVRSFLTKYPASINNDAVYFYGRKYTSFDLKNTRVFDRVARKGQIPVTAYAITMCVRHIWIEYEGAIFELDVVGSASVHPDSINISLRDLLEINEARLASLGEWREEARATEHYYKNKFKRLTGKEWDSGREKLGRAVKDASSKRDEADYRRLMGKRS